MTTEHKRSPCSVEQSSLTSLASKRHKADLSAKVSSCLFPRFQNFFCWSMDVRSQGKVA
jgi:hypothetical protein